VIDRTGAWRAARTLMRAATWRAIARRTSVPVVKALRRMRATDAQAGLSNTSRRQNVAAAFRCKRPGKVNGRRILLIDDVMTTGATAASCAQALKRAGAQKVALLTVARVDRRMDGRRRAAAEFKAGGVS